MHVPAQLQLRPRRSLRANDAEPFIDAYLADGSEAPTLLALLAPRWSEIFTHLIDGPPSHLEVHLVLAASALGAAKTGATYASSEGVAAYISTNYADMPLFTSDAAPEAATRLATVLAQLDAEIPSLNLLAPAQRSAIHPGFKKRSSNPPENAERDGNVVVFVA